MTPYVNTRIESEFATLDNNKPTAISEPPIRMTLLGPKRSKRRPMKRDDRP
jgi:hypothetical protein